MLYYIKMSRPNLPLGQKDLPEPPPLKKLLGPSFILLGLGLGSGEIILWPYLAANYGLGIAWAIIVGITMQFFINMEVERYALVFGESVFVGFARFLKWLPIWFIGSTLLGFGWPGIGLTSATLITAASGLNTTMVAIGLFILIGLILSIGKVVYKTVERFQMTLISLSIPALLILTAYLTKRTDLTALTQGFLGIGEDYRFIPKGIEISAFLAALAYTGAGGNLNLSQSFYIRDKGYGMGAYAQKIKSIFTSTGHSEKISLTGNTFAANEANIARFKKWWKVTNTEHFLVFFLLGAVTTIMLTLLSYATTFGTNNNEQGINFVINEAKVIGTLTAPYFSTLFLLVAGLMLFATQLTVLDSTSRIITENFLLLRRKTVTNAAKIYYITLWIQIGLGILIFSLGFNQPRQLLTIGAVINAFTMFSYTLLLLHINNRYMKKQMRPSFLRNLALISAFVFLGLFCSATLLSYVKN